jgi:hypothetical protein
MEQTGTSLGDLIDEARDIEGFPARKEFVSCLLEGQPPSEDTWGIVVCIVAEDVMGLTEEEKDHLQKAFWMDVTLDVERRRCPLELMFFRVLADGFDKGQDLDLRFYRVLADGFGT